MDPRAWRSRRLAPLAHFPPLGTPPYDSASIAARLNGVTVDWISIRDLETLLSNLEATSPPISWPADGGGPGLDVEAGMLLSPSRFSRRLRRRSAGTRSIAVPHVGADRLPGRCGVARHQDSAPAARPSTP